MQTPVEIYLNDLYAFEEVTLSAARPQSICMYDGCDVVLARTGERGN